MAVRFAFNGVEEVAPSGLAPPQATSEERPQQRVGLCTGLGDARLACASVGHGPDSGQGGQLAQPPRRRLGEPSGGIGGGSLSDKDCKPPLPIVPKANELIWSVIIFAIVAAFMMMFAEIGRAHV